MPSNSVVKDTLVVGGLSLLGFLAGGKLGSMFGAVIGTIVVSLCTNEERGMISSTEKSHYYSDENHSYKDIGNQTCAICLEQFDPVIMLIPCKHACFCYPCYGQVKRQNVSSCPICRKSIEKFIFI